MAITKAAQIAATRLLRLHDGIHAERERLYQLHARGEISDETLRIIEAELDEREIMSSVDPMRG